MAKCSGLMPNIGQMQQITEWVVEYTRGGCADTDTYLIYLDTDRDTDTRNTIEVMFCEVWCSVEIDKAYIYLAGVVRRTTAIYKKGWFKRIGTVIYWSKEEGHTLFMEPPPKNWNTRLEAKARSTIRERKHFVRIDRNNSNQHDQLAFLG